MDRPTAIPLRVGAWCVNPTSGQISREGETVRVEARTMRLLLCLAEHAGDVVSMDALLEQVWPGVIVTQDSVYQAMASLRRQLGDDAKEPAYIATVPRLGYRMVATVSPWGDEPLAPMVPAPAVTGATSNGVITGKSTFGLGRRAGVLVAAGGALCVALIVAFPLLDKIENKIHASATAATPPRSVAVLPFLDLTSQKMDEEYFADGMTEELIDKLSKIPGLHVPAPASSFYYKGRHIAVADIAKSLGVVYVLSGSVRESDARLRVAVRLVRADDGYVVWSETYDRQSDNKLMVQEQIATEVTKALKAEIN
jgi:TolB-like protein/DNA-binding winged helix-turn-helix (wHTH) protein